jgi:hypothetical protein
MSFLTYNADVMATNDKPLVWLSAVANRLPFQKKQDLKPDFC